MELTAAALAAYEADRRRMVDDGVGKAVFGRVYLHRAWLRSLGAYPAAARAAREALREARAVGVDGVLVSLGPGAVSALAYPRFEAEREPRLTASASVPLRGGAPERKTYDPANPPVLHRKELVAPPAMRRPAWLRRTRELEGAGLFGDRSRIGRLAPWRVALRRVGLPV